MNMKPEENELKKLAYQNDGYDGFNRTSPEGGIDGCDCPSDGRYRGGMSLNGFQKFIWKRTSMDVSFL
jgi:hypothetical protein